MPDESNRLASVSALLRQGQALEAAGHFTAAVVSFDRAIALCPPVEGGGPTARLRLCGIAWMNRGSALHKLATPEAMAAARDAYNRAITTLEKLSFERDPALRNSLAAALTNRGRLLQLDRAPHLLADAIASHERAITLLAPLVSGTSPLHVRRNLAGAWLNLADARLGLATTDALDRALEAARRALALVGEREDAAPEFADLGLKARRALVDAIGRLLSAPDRNGDGTFPETELAAEAGDAIDGGLALARRWESRSGADLRPLALRLFRFGGQFYGRRQPHFLAEFLQESIGPGAPYAADPEFRAAAIATVDAAWRHLRTPRPLLAGTPTTDRLLAAAEALRRARELLSPAVPAASAPFPTAASEPSFPLP